MKNPGKDGSESTSDTGAESGWSKFVNNLNNINALNILPGQSPAGRDADEVVAAVTGFNAPVSVVDLARKLGWDADRLAQALSYAADRGRVAFSTVQNQTFVGLPAA
jgi:hypothetical protein